MPFRGHGVPKRLRTSELDAAKKAIDELQRKNIDASLARMAENDRKRMRSSSIDEARQTLGGGAEAAEAAHVNQGAAAPVVDAAMSIGHVPATKSAARKNKYKKIAKNAKKAKRVSGAFCSPPPELYEDTFWHQSEPSPAEAVCSNKKMNTPRALEACVERRLTPAGRAGGRKI